MRRKDSERLGADLLGLGLGSLVDEGLVDVGNDTAAGDSGLDEGVELLVTTDGKLEMAGGDTLHAEIARGVAGKLENLGADCKFQGGGGVSG